MNISSFVNQSDQLRHFTQEGAFRGLCVDSRFDRRTPSIGTAYSSELKDFFSPLYTLTHIGSYSSPEQIQHKGETVSGFLTMDLYDGAIRFSETLNKDPIQTRIEESDQGEYFIAAAPLFMSVCTIMLPPDGLAIYHPPIKGVPSEWQYIKSYLNGVTVQKMYKALNCIKDGSVPAQHPFRQSPDVRYGMLRRVLGYDRKPAPLLSALYEKLRYTVEGDTII